MSISIFPCTLHCLHTSSCHLLFTAPQCTLCCNLCAPSQWPFPISFPLPNTFKSQAKGKKKVTYWPFGSVTWITFWWSRRPIFLHIVFSGFSSWIEELIMYGIWTLDMTASICWAMCSEHGFVPKSKSCLSDKFHILLSDFSMNLRIHNVQTVWAVEMT